jgi:hypothetical protein
MATLTELVVITTYGSMGVMFPGAMTIRILKVEKSIVLPFRLRSGDYPEKRFLSSPKRDTRLFPWLLLWDGFIRLVRRSADKVGNKDSY